MPNGFDPNIGVFTQDPFVAGIQSTLGMALQLRQAEEARKERQRQEKQQEEQQRASFANQLLMNAFTNPQLAAILPSLVAEPWFKKTLPRSFAKFFEPGPPLEQPEFGTTIAPDVVMIPPEAEAAAMGGFPVGEIVPRGPSAFAEALARMPQPELEPTLQIPGLPPLEAGQIPAPLITRRAEEAGLIQPEQPFETAQRARFKTFLARKKLSPDMTVEQFLSTNPSLADLDKVDDIFTPRPTILREAPLATGERIKIADALSTLDEINTVRNLFDPTFVGVVKGPIGGFKGTFERISPREANFRAFTKLLRVSQRRFFFGTAQTTGELAGALEAIVDTDLGPESFLAALNASEAKLQSTIRRLQQVTTGVGVRFPTSILDELSDNEVLTMSNEELLELFEQQDRGGSLLKKRFGRP